MSDPASAAPASAAFATAAARPRLVLHIGAHKTGSTSIQNALEAGRSALLAQGVLYPETRREPWPELPKHTSVFHAAIQDSEPARAAERDALMREFEASAAGTLLLSEEGLSEPIPRLIEFFLPWRDRFEIEVVCFVRRPDLFVESLYSQFVREPERREARPPVMFSRAAPIRERMDFAAMLAHWQDRLGAQVRVVDFDLALRSSGLIGGFSDAARLPAAGLADRPANRSPDLRLVLALRRLNQAGRAYHLPTLLRAVNELSRQGRFPPLRHVLGADERRRLLDAMAGAHERLASRFGVRFNMSPPEGEPAAATEDVEPAYLLELLALASQAGAGGRT
jgi:hypothetical protein